MKHPKETKAKSVAMNDQRSTKEQLDDLEKLAVANGLYDAHDWLIRARGRA